MSFHEFIEPIAVETPLGTGRALFVESTPHDYWWTIALDETQAIVTFDQSRLRIHRSYTYERGINDDDMRKIIKR